MRITLPIVKLNAIGYFFDDKEAIAQFEKEETLIYEIWRSFLSSPFVDQGIGFQSGIRGIEVISKGIEDPNKVRFSSFIRLDDDSLAAILHHEYALDEIDELIQDYLIVHSRDEKIFEVCINTPNRVETL